MVSNIFNGSRIFNNVKITLYRDNVPYKVVDCHNTAKIGLCKYLRDALYGKNINAKRPGIITPCGVDASLELVDIGAGSPVINDKVIATEDGDEAALITMTFLIPNQILTSGTEIYGFRLYSKDISKTLYAEVKLSDLGLGPIVAGGDSNMKVEWTLAVSYI